MLLPSRTSTSSGPGVGEVWSDSSSEVGFATGKAASRMRFGQAGPTLFRLMSDQSGSTNLARTAMVTDSLDQRPELLTPRFVTLFDRDVCELCAAWGDLTSGLCLNPLSRGSQEPTSCLAAIGGRVEVPDWTVGPRRN